MSELLSQINEGILTLSINRPEALNALNETVLSELLKEIEKVKNKSQGYETLRVLVLRGHGEKAFVAGADIKAMSEKSSEELKRYIDLGQAVMNGLEQVPVPVFALVQGFCLGGGMELALASDFIVASQAARFGQPEINLGLIPGFGGTQRLQLRLGLGRTRRLVMCGETLKAQQALEVGLVDWVFETEEFETQAEHLCRDFSAKAPQALAAAKRSMQNLFGGVASVGLTKEADEFLNLFKTADAKEGVKAFLEKRKPVFSGS